MTTITALPTPPDRSNPATFASRADAFVDALPTFVTETNAVASEVSTNASNAATAASNASDAATTASNAVLAATAAAGSAKWVSGTTYAVGNCVWSPFDFQTYRRKTDGSGTTDPSSDSTNWQKISGFITQPMLHVVDQKVSGTSAGNSALNATMTRTLNTTRINTISGASLASNTITLPAGTYDIDAVVPGYNNLGMMAYLYNSSDSTDVLLGSSFGTSSSYPSQNFGHIKGRFTIAATNNFQIKHYFSGSGSVTDGLGKPSISVKSEVYTQVVIKQVG